MNDLERQLRSWVPRRPSARLERHLFPRARKHRHSLGFRLGWLAPATASLLLAALLMGQHSGRALGSATAAPMVALMLSNQSAAAYLPGTFQGENNRLPPGYQWTASTGGISNPNILPLRALPIRSSNY